MGLRRDPWGRRMRFRGMRGRVSARRGRHGSVRLRRMCRRGGMVSGTKWLDLRVVTGRSRAEREIRPDHAAERGSAGGRELPEVLGIANANREPVTVRFHELFADYDDGVRAKLWDRVVFGSLTERDES